MGVPGAQRRIRRWALVLAVAVSTSCGATAGPSDTPLGQNSASPSTTATTPARHSVTPPATSRITPTREPPPITIAFAGDVHFEGPLGSVLDEPGTALRPVAAQLSAADVTVVNLETSVGAGGAPESKRFTFQAPPQAFDALAAAGVDVVTMANNHAMDFGSSGLADTLAAIAADLPLSVVGIGPDAATAFAPALVDVGATSVAVIGAHSADDPRADPTAHWAAGDDRPGVAVARDPAPLIAAVRAARQAADVVVVFMHWGIQGEQCPSESQRRTAGAVAAAGANIVVGSHAHTVQGAGLLGDTYVAYGLGNFVWYQPGPTALLTLSVEGGQVVHETWTAGRIGSDGLPRLDGSSDTRELAADLERRRACSDLAPL